MDSSFYVLLVIVVVFISVNGQLPQSPCPGTFDYANDGQNVYGVIHVVLHSKLTFVEVRVNFTIVTALSSNYIGRLAPDGRTDQLNPGVTLKYRVDFPVQRPLPKLTKLTVNGETLCYGPADYALPGQTVTTVTLLHSLRTVSYNIQYNTNNISPSWKIPFKPINTPVIEPGGDFVAYVAPTGTFIKPQNIPTNTQETWIYPPRIPTNRVTHTPPSVPPPSVPPPSVPPPSVLPPKFESTETPVVAPFIPPGQSSTQYECGRPKIIAPPLIIGGEHFLRGAFPWLVALSKIQKKERKFICGASLVSEQHVVTAAHCQRIRDQEIEVEQILVTVGAFDLDDLADNEAQNFYVKHAIPHTDYDPFSFKNDIMVITLKKKVVYNDYIIPICLWDETFADLSDIVGRKGTIAGWGTNEEGNGGMGKPRKARIPIVSTEECRRSNKDFIDLTSDKTICAGDRNKISPCDGDSGGGLYLRYKGVEGENNNDQPMRLRGVVSVSLQNKDDDSEYDCNIQDYVVFTDVAKFTPWIKNIIDTTQ